MPVSIIDNLAFYMIDFPDHLCREYFFRRSACQNLSVTQNIKSVAEHGCHIQVMNRRDDSNIQAFNNIQKLQLIGNVQMVGRFIQNKARRFLRQCPGKNYSLLFPSGKSGEASVRHRKHVHFIQGFPHNLIILHTCSR